MNIQTSNFKIGLGLLLPWLPKVISEKVGQTCRFAWNRSSDSLPFRRLLLAIAITLVAGGCISTPVKPRPIEPYMKVEHSASGNIELQVAMRKFVPQQGRGPAVWLVAASHVGETNYYAALQSHLDAQTLVLFEGIRDRNGKTKTQSKEERQRDARESSPLQSNMAAAMGLVFQLEAIDYDRKNFQNSDLSIPQLTKLMMAAPQEKDGETSGTSQQFQSLIEAMSGNSLFSGIINLVFKAIGSDPKFRAMAKLALIGVFDDLKGDLTHLGGLPPEMKELIRVIIEERNKQVISDLRPLLVKYSRKDSIAIFYGSGHMFDLEKRLTTELSYRVADEIWVPAFSVNPKTSGLSEAEIGTINSLVQWQMKMMQ